MLCSLSSGVFSLYFELFVYIAAEHLECSLCMLFSLHFESFVCIAA